MRLDEFSDRFTSARGQIKVVAAAVVAAAGLGAAVWAYTSTRSDRNFDHPTGGTHVGANLSPEQRKQMEESAKAAAAEAEKNAAPREFKTLASGKAAGALDALPEKVTAAMQNGDAASSISGADRASVGERVKIALGGLVSGSREQLDESIKALGGVVKPADPNNPDAPRRDNPLAKLLEGADIDLANITVDKPRALGMMGGPPQPGSGQFRVTANETETVGGGPDDKGGAPGAEGSPNVKRVTLKPGDKIPEGMMPPGGGKMSFNSLIAMRTDSFPAVKDYQSQNLPTVEVKVPAKLKGSKNTTPDMDLGVIMAQAPDGQWQPAGYNIYAKSQDVQTRLMEQMMSGSKGAKVSFGAPKEQKTETSKAAPETKPDATK